MRSLKQKSQWVCWRYVDRDGRKTKVPLDPKNGRFARTNDPTTWATFDEAERAVTKWNCDGVGVILTDGLCGVDIDANGHSEINPLQQEILSLFSGSYCERSPSGKGVHILFRADVSKLPQRNGKLDTAFYTKNPRNGCEIYIANLTNRFLTVTFDRISDSDVISDATDEAITFLRKFMQREEVGREQRKLTAERGKRSGFAAPAVYYPTANGEENDAIEEALRVARHSKNAAKFEALFDRGDLTAYNDDASSGDLALCCLLSFYLHGDEELIDAAFRRSALFREKWNRSDYRDSTIAKAIALCGGEYYRRPGRPRVSEAKNGDGGELFTIEACKVTSTNAALPSV